ncbi:MAG: dihydrolipoyllysine-residue succinyltransferase [Sulfuriferula multivorans]|uniref:Dihydrolipoyllysine-residue succinyltransferase n=1 Tax=Sulfuriferula multivorans TaxID=1559896 RepID=A0A7C9P9A9_9PROT|nr:dihydrolipoyllysine-residue succinyltransferase [Sulfuriferula multivorans]
MKIDVRVPTLSDSVSSGTLLPWRKQIGDQVARDETLVDLETDKVILEIPSPASGRLIDLRQSEGAVVKADEVVAVIETDDQAATTVPKQPALTVPPQDPPAAVVETATAEKAVIDVPVKAQAVVPSAKPSDPLSLKTANETTTTPGETRREPMSRLRTRVAERLVAAQHTAAMLTTFNEVNMASVIDLRQRFKGEFEIKHGVKLGYMSFFVRAVCQALVQFPIVNASIDGSDIVWPADVDIGIAISSPRGLVVPILRRAQTLSSARIEAGIADFGLRARDAKLTLDDLSGGTFSLTNGGVFGSLLSTPILNPPQSAILGMHTIQERPIAENGQVVIRPMMYLALTYDHRLIDGREAVQFLVAVKAALETPEALLSAV